MSQMRADNHFDITYSSLFEENNLMLLDIDKNMQNEYVYTWTTCTQKICLVLRYNNINMRNIFVNNKGSHNNFLFIKYHKICKYWPTKHIIFIQKIYTVAVCVGSCYIINVGRYFFFHNHAHFFALQIYRSRKICSDSNNT